jgi:hypothetical protein
MYQPRARRAKPISDLVLRGGRAYLRGIIKEAITMKPVRTLLSALLAVACLLPAAMSASAEEGWTPIFNGKDLEGWTPKIRGHELGENPGNTYRVEDGILRVAYDQYTQFEGKFGHLFYKHPFTNYIVRAEYRFVGDQCPGGPGWAFRNSGIMVHCQDPKTMGRDQNFPVCIEVQLLGGNGKDPRTTGNLCSPGTHVVMNGQLMKQHCFNSTSKTFHGEQWVTIEVEVLGNASIKHRINGELVLEYEQPQLDEGDGDAKKLIVDGKTAIESGYISLQAESHPVEFRKVDIKTLDR